MHTARCHCSIHSKVVVDLCLLLAFLSLLCLFLLVRLDSCTVRVLLVLQGVFSFSSLSSLCCSSSSLHLLPLLLSPPRVVQLLDHLEGGQLRRSRLGFSPSLFHHVPARRELGHKPGFSKIPLLAVVDGRLNSKVCDLPNLLEPCLPSRPSS